MVPGDPGYPGTRVPTLFGKSSDDFKKYPGSVSVSLIGTATVGVSFIVRQSWHIMMHGQPHTRARRGEPDHDTPSPCMGPSKHTRLLDVHDGVVSVQNWRTGAQRRGGQTGC
eukprot:3112446-Rhodomonas_salina.1